MTFFIYSQTCTKTVAIVLTTHDLNGMAAHLPHLICVNHRVIADGTPEDVIARGSGTDLRSAHGSSQDLKKVWLSMTEANEEIEANG